MTGRAPAWRPPHAYVPGQTARHPEDLFDRFKTGIGSVPPSRLHETRTWKLGLAFLREGYNWEAHEMFEAVWMACPPNSAEKLLVQALIQQANGALKRRMGRFGAAERLARQARRLMVESFRRARGPVLGIADADAGCRAFLSGDRES